MLNHPNFYHSLTRQYVSAFGTIFNDIYVSRSNADASQIQEIPVPIKYGPALKWVYAVAQNPQERTVEIQLPRMAFEITSVTHDNARKIVPITTNTNVVEDRAKLLKGFAQIPKKVNWELFIMTKNADDAWQIAEQIMAFFNEDFNFSMELIPGLGKKWDIRLQNTSFTPQDTYTGDFKERRLMLFKFDFEMSCWYFGPLEKQGVIKKVQIDFHIPPGGGKITTTDILNTGRSERLITKPGLTSSGEPTSDPSQSIPYQQIKATDDYGFIESIEHFDDGKRYDPISGEDH